MTIDEKREALSKELGPAVQKMVCGEWREAVPMLAAVVGTTLGSQLVGPILGPMIGSTAGGVASLVATLLSSSAEKRMMEEDARLNSEIENASLVAEYIGGSLLRLQRDASTELGSLVNSLDEQSALRDQEALRSVLSWLQACESRLGNRADKVEQLVEEKFEELEWRAAEASARRYQFELDTASRHSEVIAAINREKGVPLAPLRAILARLGEACVADERIAEALSKKADEYIQLVGRMTRLTMPEVDEARATVLLKIERGELHEAGQMLGDIRKALRAGRHRLSRDEAELMSEEAQIDLLQIRYRSAAEKYAEAAALVRDADPEEFRRYRRHCAAALFSQGEELGDIEALDDAIDCYTDILEERTMIHGSNEWAAVQNNLGAVLLVMGERTTIKDYYVRAAAAHRASLVIWTRETSPVDWAMSQTNLGNALAKLGEFDAAEDLEHAVNAYEEALLEYNRESSFDAWVTVKNNLASALHLLGKRDVGTERLERALSVFGDALVACTDSGAPKQAAMVQYNLGLLLIDLGSRANNTVRFEEAIAACKRSLTAITRERFPFRWAQTQTTLGNAYWELYERNGDQEHLLGAIESYQEALKEYTSERAPLARAAVQW